MIVWRFSRHVALDGRGGLLAPGRWHSRGREILYCAPNPATALLEVLAHSAVRTPEALGDFQFVKIEIPDGVPRERVEDNELPANWTTRPEMTRVRGDLWLREGTVALLIVRSVLVPETYNVLINPRHTDAVQVARLAAFRFPLDERLFTGTN